MLCITIDEFKQFGHSCEIIAGDRHHCSCGVFGFVDDGFSIKIPSGQNPKIIFKCPNKASNQQLKQSINLTEPELTNIGFIRRDWNFEGEVFHDYILEGNSPFKIEVCDDFSSSLVVGCESRSLPRSTGIKELQNLANILCIV